MTIGASKVFKLAVPIADDAGSTWTSITLREPTLRDQANIQRRTTLSGTEQAAQLIAALSGIPESAVRRLKTRDVRRMERWQRRLVDEAIALDITADDDGALAPSKTFRLASPIETEATPITEITVREPDLEAGIAIEKFKTAGEQTAAMLAALSGLPIPAVMRLAARDVARIERWLSFFSKDGDLSEEEDETEPVASETAPGGETSPSSSPAN